MKRTLEETIEIIRSAKDVEIYKTAIDGNQTLLYAGSKHHVPKQYLNLEVIDQCYRFKYPLWEIKVR